MVVIVIWMNETDQLNDMRTYLETFSWIVLAGLIFKAWLWWIEMNTAGGAKAPWNSDSWRR